VKEILDEIETEFFKQLETVGDEPSFYLLETLKDEIKLNYQRSVTIALANYLDNVYIQ